MKARGKKRLVRGFFNPVNLHCFCPVNLHCFMSSQPPLFLRPLSRHCFSCFLHVNLHCFYDLSTCTVFMTCQPPLFLCPVNLHCFYDLSISTVFTSVNRHCFTTCQSPLFLRPDNLHCFYDLSVSTVFTTCQSSLFLRPVSLHCFHDLSVSAVFTTCQPPLFLRPVSPQCLSCFYDLSTSTVFTTCQLLLFLCPVSLHWRTYWLLCPLAFMLIASTRSCFEQIHIFRVRSMRRSVLREINTNGNQSIWKREDTKGVCWVGFPCLLNHLPSPVWNQRFSRAREWAERGWKTAKQSNKNNEKTNKLTITLKDKSKVWGDF